MSENLRFAFQGIRSHKMRSFLTMLGVIIGIASIIAIVSTIKGTNEQIMQNLIGSGNNSITISLKQGDYDYDAQMGSAPGVPPVSEEKKEEIRSMKDVEDASFYLNRGYVEDIRIGNAKLEQGQLRGIDSHYLSAAGMRIYQGRGFTPVDFKNGAKLALLDESAASLLSPDRSPVGRIVEIQGEPFTVAGLIRRSDAFRPVIEKLNDYYTYYQNAGGIVYIPDTAWPIVFGFDEPQFCVVKARNTPAMSRVGKDTEKLLNEGIAENSEQIRYKAADLLEKAKNQQKLSASTNNMLIWIASIALLVGGIGVMNIMLVSVTERTSEIGLKKAIGARKRTILTQFLTESALLTSIGGILGVLSGLILAFAISKMAQVPVAISIPSIILGVGFSTVIGVVFGLLPSVKAANLNPIDALRRE